MSKDEGGMDPETRKQVLALIGEVVTLGAVLLASDPDAARTVSMWWWRKVADTAGDIAEKAGRIRLAAYARYYREAGQ